MKLSKKVWQSLAVLALLANLAACGDSDSSSSSDTDTSTSDSSGTDNSGSSSSSGSISVSDFSDISLGDCELDTSLESLVCAANALIDT
jgi:predicted small lipoprotein YifL